LDFLSDGERGPAFIRIGIIRPAFDPDLKKIGGMLKRRAPGPVARIAGTMRKPCLGLTDGRVDSR
jgi:hypothetical protein